MSTRILFLALLPAVGGCDRGAAAVPAGGSPQGMPRVVISEVMANPSAVPDEHGEWLEVRNLEARAVDLRGWSLASEHDAGATIGRPVVVAPGAYLVLARDGDRARNGGVDAAYAYGGAVALGNRADWVALRLPDGRTVDSVAWSSVVAGASRGVRDPARRHRDVMSATWATATSRFGGGDRGTPGRENDGSAAPGAVVAAEPSDAAPADAAPPRVTARATRSGAGPVRLDSATANADAPLVIRVLDVGQGDAIYIENGGSKVLIDGGPEPSRLGRLLDQFGLDGDTIDVVVVTHQHTDHYTGLRELFTTRRGVHVRYVFENKDPHSVESLADLRDSILARVEGGLLVYRDTDDPCGNGSASCTITLRGGARLHILRPPPRGSGPNNRSAAVKLMARDSTAFSMWLSGDAEREELAWFDATDYDRLPGMRSSVLKVNHHGSCDGISARFLDLVRPRIAVISLAANNDYGYVHTQTLELLRARGIPWYRTDQNGTVTLTVDGTSVATAVDRGAASMRGPRDRVSTQEDCRP